MKINTIHTLILSVLLFTACSTQKITKDVNQTTVPTIQTHNRIDTPAPLSIASGTSPSLNTVHVDSVHLNTPSVNTVHLDSTLLNTNYQEEYSSLGGEFSANRKLMNFIERMNREHNFEYPYLYKLFSNAQNSNQVVIPCKTTPNQNGRCVSDVKPKGKWDRYRGMFVYERNIDRGVAFWEEHEQTLNRAYQEYGVLPEFIIGIIGIETAYGVNFGKKRVIDVLTTKGMLGDRRERFYTKQLEKFLIMTRDSNLDASTLMGSNAGAMGYGQFIASSYLAFAVDFNGDGITDLWNAEDAIGSVANYFAKNGWKRNIREVVTRAKYRGTRFKRLKTGYKTKYSQYKLRKKYGITARKKLRYKGPVSLIKLPKHAYDELWFGTHNFRVITTYNHSTFYGMAVNVLGQAVKTKRYGR